MIHFIMNADGSIQYTSKELSINEIESTARFNPHISNVVNRITSVASYLKLNNAPDYFTEAVRYSIYNNLLLYGEVFIVKIIPTGTEEVKELLVLPTPMVSVQYNERLLTKDITSIHYESRVFTPEQFVHIYYSNPSSMYPRGLSPLASLQTVYRSSNYVLAYEENAYKNSGVKGILSGSSDMPLTPTERAALQSQFDAETIGLEKVNKVRITQGAVNFTSLSSAPKDMLSTESQLEKLRIVCAAFNVDSSLFNDKAASTYNNMKEANKAFYHNAILPLVDKVNQSLLSLFQAEIDYLDIDALKEDEKLLSESRKQHAEAKKIELENAKMMLELGLVTLEELKQSLLIY